MNTSYPQKFYGTELRNIRTEADAVEALDQFIRNASEDEVSEACRELELSVGSEVREIINKLLWKLAYPLSSKEFERCFALKYHSC